MRKKIERNIAYDDIKEKYYVTLEFGIDPLTGKRIRKRKTYDTITAARKALRKHEAERDAGRAEIPRDITLEEWLNEWMESIVTLSRAETTIYAYNQMIRNHIVPAIGKIQLQKITPMILQRYYAELMRSKKLSSNTVKKHHNLLHLALKTAQKQGMLQTNPADMVEAPKTVTPEIGYYNMEQLQQLFSLSEGNRLEVVIKLGGILGMRREEIMGLKWDAIDFENRIISISEVRTSAGSEIVVKEPKTGSSYRTLYMPDEIVKILRNEYDAQQENKAFFKNSYNDSGYVVVTKDGTPIRPNYISELFKNFISDNNLPPITLHGLRHSFASVANAKGVTLYDIGKVLGHSTPSTTGKIYTHLFDKNHQELLDKMWND